LCAAGAAAGATFTMPSMHALLLVVVLLAVGAYTRLGRCTELRAGYAPSLAL